MITMQSLVAVSLICTSVCGVTWAQITTNTDGTTGKGVIPDKLVVLTFDDSAKSHYTVVRWQSFKSVKRFCSNSNDVVSHFQQ